MKINIGEFPVVQDGIIDRDELPFRFCEFDTHAFTSADLYPVKATCFKVCITEIAAVQDTVDELCFAKIAAKHNPLKDTSIKLYLRI